MVVKILSKTEVSEPSPVRHTGLASETLMHCPSRPYRHSPLVDRWTGHPLLFRDDRNGKFLAFIAMFGAHAGKEGADACTFFYLETNNGKVKAATGS